MRGNEGWVDGFAYDGADRIVELVVAKDEPQAFWRTEPALSLRQATSSVPTQATDPASCERRRTTHAPV